MTESTSEHTSDTPENTLETPKGVAMSAEVSINPKTDPNIESIVRVEGLKRAYQQADRAVYALNGVDFEVKRGEFSALMGPSGSGKTTLLNCVGALDLPTEGEVWVRGRALSTLSKRDRATLRRDEVGFVFQSYNLLPVLTAYENAEFVLLARGVPEAERRERVMELLDAVGLGGLEGRRPAELSGGQQQRVAIARAMAGEPALILADEPTANLDTKTGAALIELMRALNETRGVTFLFSTHDPQVMEAARRVIKLVDGQIDHDLVKS